MDFAKAREVIKELSYEDIEFLSKEENRNALQTALSLFDEVERLRKVAKYWEERWIFCQERSDKDFMDMFRLVEDSKAKDKQISYLQAENEKLKSKWCVGNVKECEHYKRVSKERDNLQAKLSELEKVNIEKIERTCYCRDVNHAGNICPIGKEYAKRVRGLIAVERSALPDKVVGIGKLKARIIELEKGRMSEEEILTTIQDTMCEKMIECKNPQSLTIEEIKRFLEWVSKDIAKALSGRIGMGRTQ